MNYGTSIATIPAAALEVMDRATSDDLKVLLLLAAEPALLSGDGAQDCVARIALRSGCAPARVGASLAFWRGAGILNLSEEEESAEPSLPVESDPAKPIDTSLPASPAREEAPRPATPAEPSAPSRKPHTSDALPHYTSAELSALLETRTEAAEYLKECQNIWGKVFNIHEHNIILGLTDYLGLEWDYIIALLAFCAKELDKRGARRSLHYVETRAFSFYDEGVTDLPSLQEKLRRVERMEEVEGQLRRLFGLGERILTPTEKKKFSAWLYEYQYGMDVITRAFEVTVDAKGSPNLKYMDAVLANWNRDGLRTLEDIARSEAKFWADKEKKNGKPTPNGQEGTFDTDDFFDAAVRRSLGEDFVTAEADTGSQT